MTIKLTILKEKMSFQAPNDYFLQSYMRRNNFKLKTTRDKKNIYRKYNKRIQFCGKCYN